MFNQNRDMGKAEITGGGVQYAFQFLNIPAFSAVHGFSSQGAKSYEELIVYSVKTAVDFRIPLSCPKFVETGEICQPQSTRCAKARAVARASERGQYKIASQSAKYVGVFVMSRVLPNLGVRRFDVGTGCGPLRNLIDTAIPARKPRRPAFQERT